jgi:hypothetical protein
MRSWQILPVGLASTGIVTRANRGWSCAVHGTTFSRGAGAAAPPGEWTNGRDRIEDFNSRPRVDLRVFW